IRITPDPLARVFFSDSGSTSVEVALKMALQFWHQRGSEFKGKTKFLTLSEGYHGDTIGAVSLGGIELFGRPFRSVLFDTIKAPSPYCYRCPFEKKRSHCRFDCLRALERLVKTHHKELAAVFIEPLIQGAAGMITQPPGYLGVVRDVCTRHKVLLIADEVATGFGRTGRMFACEHEDVSPDIMTVAKGLTGGYMPLAATLATETVFDEFLGSFLDRRTFFHGHTFTGNPLACAAALASLRIFEEDDVIAKLEPKIEALAGELAKISRLPHVGHVRQAGFMAGIELVLDKRTTEPYDPGDRMGHKVSLAARRSGAFLRPLGDVVVLVPPLSMTERELLMLCDIVHDAIERTTQ
ncbi:MAG: adenosylmethionine--8-amino-7-oxononanoate transaminase, partial [Planctomycetota bacterium]|nr:adenosylmethionine--8-amino-7-oxononanoate transaminase [Planctomycetota bacterium]